KGETSTQPPELYAIVGGVSTYSAEALNLRYAAKDAEDMAKTLQLGAKRLFGVERVHITILSTSGNAGTIPPTKENFSKAFEVARRAKPDDILVVYLAGHGVAVKLSGETDTYCYLTQEARSTDLTDPAVRETNSISSEEMVEWIKRIPALKQVMVLDTCAAGAAQAKLTESRTLSSDQIRAIERLKDRTGFHVLMGAAADKLSYETSQFSQGLLTYSLLEGMKGAALHLDEFVDVSKLFQYAADRVPELARGIRLGGIQKPVIATPKGGASFEVGQLKREDKEAIKLAVIKPLLLRPSLQNRDEGFDNLELEGALRKRLREESFSTTRGSTDWQQAVYVEADELPGAIRPSGLYTVEGDIVKLTINLIRDNQRISSFQLAGSKSDKPKLVAEIVRGLDAALKKLPSKG